ETPYYEAEHRLRCKDGSYKWILDRGCVTSWTAERAPHRMVGTHTDISKSKDAERLLRRSLEDKEILLKEVHHRVKNNLQVTSSLLNLQATTVSDQAAQEALREAQGRIHSIALLHERLYQAEDFGHVNLREYTTILVNELRRTLGRSRISLEIDAADIEVELDMAMPYALLLNELVTNAFKHAFPENVGTIAVCLRPLGGAAELVVRDDGVGLPPGYALETSRSLGMTLVRLLAKQMRGTLSMRSDRGTVATLRFPYAGPVEALGAKRSSDRDALQP
ncbi:MAG: PAS domain-containing protein, partial [Polyangiaceae bacterium]|nr:PAS domain-containing protein [Polyangiaceae bacterium]